MNMDDIWIYLKRPIAITRIPCFQWRILCKHRNTFIQYIRVIIPKYGADYYFGSPRNGLKSMFPALFTSVHLCSDADRFGLFQIDPGHEPVKLLPGQVTYLGPVPGPLIAAMFD